MAILKKWSKNTFLFEVIKAKGNTLWDTLREKKNNNYVRWWIWKLPSLIVVIILLYIQKKNHLSIDIKSIQANKDKYKTWNHKTRREYRQNTSWHKSYKCVHRSVSQGNRNKSKNKQTGPNQTYKLLYSKRNHKQNEKTAYKMG